MACSERSFLHWKKFSAIPRLSGCSELHGLQFADSTGLGLRIGTGVHSEVSGLPIGRDLQ